MHINQLPLELLQKIFSYMSYGEQLNILSFVCHHWLRAVETFVVRRGRFIVTGQVLEHLEAVPNLIRCYKVLCIPAVQDWLGLRLVILKCMRAFPEASELYVDGFPQNFQPRFFPAYRSWEEQRQQTGEDGTMCKSEAFVQTLPDLNRLIWLDCLEYNGAHRPITVEDDNSEDCADLRPEVRFGLKRKIDSSVG